MKEVSQLEQENETLEEKSSKYLMDQMKLFWLSRARETEERQKEENKGELNKYTALLRSTEGRKQNTISRVWVGRGSDEV